MMFATLRLTIISLFRFIGFMVYCFSVKRKPVALKNVNLCFPPKNKCDQKKNNKIVRGSFISLGHSFADFLLLRFYTKKNIDKFIKIKNFDLFKKVFDQKKGVIFSAAHFGSWELAAHFFALKGFKNLILYNPIKRPNWLEVFVKKNREIAGNVLIPKQKSFLAIYRKIRKGGVVTLVTDQNCSPADGIKAPLFGHNVWTHTAFIKLSLKTGAPIIPGYIFTKGLFGYEIELFDPLLPQDFIEFKDAEYRMACACNKALEKSIRKAPDHWMWQHKRFKNLIS